MRRTPLAVDVLTRLASAASLASVLGAQTVLRTFQPPQPLYSGDRFGCSMAAVGDANGDGIADYAIGSSQDVDIDLGRVSVMSGASSFISIVQTWGSDMGSEFGWRLAPVGDVDGDGISDLLATGPAWNAPVYPAYSEVRLFSTATGVELWSDSTPLNSIPWWDRFVDGGQDVDGDGVPDYGAAGYWTNTDESLRVYSGATKTLIRAIGVPPQAPAKGPFAMLGDLDGDGKSELAYTATSGSAWVVHIVSGATGLVLRTCVAASAVPTNVYTLSMTALGDVDGDGAGDLAVGAYLTNTVHVFSGATALEIRAHTDPEAGAQFGYALAGRTDLDADGVGDLLVGAPLANEGGLDRGAVAAFSGRTGVQLFRIAYTTNHTEFGRSLAAAGDADGDGFGDFLVGAPRALGFLGRVWLYSPCPLPPRSVGTPKVNSLGCTSVTAWSGSASATSAQPFNIAANNIVNQKTGTFFYGLGDPVTVPFQGGTLSSPPPRHRTPYQSSGGNPTGSDCSGMFLIDFNARIQSGVDPALVPAARVVGQFWSRDPADPFTTNLSGGVEFVISP